jgi:hypothetical protein
LNIDLKNYFLPQRFTKVITKVLKGINLPKSELRIKSYSEFAILLFFTLNSINPSPQWVGWGENIYSYFSDWAGFTLAALRIR